MSRGGYTAAIDMWSLGCIFGELLQRIAHVGSAATPNLQARRSAQPAALALMLAGAICGTVLCGHRQLVPCYCLPKVPWVCRSSIIVRSRPHTARRWPRCSPFTVCPRQPLCHAQCIFTLVHPFPQVAPLFAIHGLPKTPEDGESFLGGPGNEMTRSELQASWSSHNLHLLVSFAPHGNLDT